MQDYITPDGKRRLWFEDDEIEQIMSGELQKAGLLPTPEQPVTDLERFVESHLGCALDQYADLPAAVLGVTVFNAGLPPAISINKDLTGSAIDEDESAPGLLGRWRATIAHEASHAVLHRMLFEVDSSQLTMFDAVTASHEQLMRCLKRDVAFARPSSDWREVQANKGMAALLMPTRVFSRVARREAVGLGFAAASVAAGSPDARQLAGVLAARFGVSRQAATIRLSTTRVISGNGQSAFGDAG